MFSKTSNIKRKLRGLSLFVLNKIENNGNAKFNENGEKIFIENLFAYFKRREQPRIVFDIGANIGEYSYMINNQAILNNINIELHLFEPTEKCFKELSNRFNQDNILLNNFGASDKNETAQIFYDKEKSSLASLYQRNLDLFGIELNNSEEIVLKRLEDYIKEQNIECVDFIKIDIEGHELKALEGLGKYLSSDFIDFIQFEYGGANLDSHSSLMDMYELLSNKGFKIAKIMKRGLELREYEAFMENFNYANYMAISNKVIKNMKS
jgi:FkbM family methyltransferase